MFVEDWTKFNTSSNSSGIDTVCVHMKQGWENIQSWANEWQVALMPHKWQAMTISNKGDSNDFPLTLSSIIIAESLTINVLGIRIHENLNWNRHLNHVAARAVQMPGVLLWTADFLNSQTLSVIYKTKVGSMNKEQRAILHMNRPLLQHKRLNILYLSDLCHSKISIPFWKK